MDQARGTKRAKPKESSQDAGHCRQPQDKASVAQFHDVGNERQVAAKDKYRRRSLRRNDIIHMFKLFLPARGT